MSYNIDEFRVKEIDGFKIPVKLLKDADDIEITDDNRMCFYFGEGGEISGFVNDGALTCEKVNLYGEGSGWVMHDIFVPAFRESEGFFVASMVWEGGDTINRISVKDGVIEWEDIEI